MFVKVCWRIWYRGSTLSVPREKPIVLEVNKLSVNADDDYFLYIESVDAICADDCAWNIFVPMHLINNHVRFQLDCGATINILPVNAYKQIANNPAHRSFSCDVIIVCLETRAFWISGLCRRMTQDYDRVCWKKYTYLTMLSPFRSLSIRKSAYVNTYFFSTDNQSPR